MIFRTSSYNIHIDLKNSDQYDLLIHGYTGALDLVSKELAMHLKTDKLDKISAETINSLEKRGYLTEKSPDEERTYIAKIAEIIHNKQKKKNHFLFAVTYDCNFRCVYCYLNEISTQGKSWSKNTFAKEMVDRAYAAMLEIEPDLKNHDKTITLYGGEPLLFENYDIVKHIIDTGVEKGYNFFAITNGYDLNYFKEFLGKEKLASLQITLDGMQDKHNSRRPHYKNTDSFDKILSNIEMALDKEIRISLRINTDGSNVDDIPDLLSLFKSKGLLENPNLNINTALAQKYESCIGDTESGVKQTMDRPKYMDEYYKAKKESNDYRVSCQDYGVTQTLQNAIKTDSLINYKSTFCAAHANMKIFDALGDIYACWDVIGMEDHKIGSYKENVDLHNDAYDMWVTRNISNIKSCSKCKYALFCGGGCAGQLALRGIEITKSNCENFPQVFSKIANEIYDTEIVKKLNQ